MHSPLETAGMRAAKAKKKKEIVEKKIKKTLLLLYEAKRLRVNSHEMRIKYRGRAGERGREGQRRGE